MFTTVPFLTLEYWLFCVVCPAKVTSVIPCKLSRFNSIQAALLLNHIIFYLYLPLFLVSDKFYRITEKLVI